MKHKNPKGHVYTFDECESILAKRDDKKIDNNTFLRRVDADTFAIQLHRTDVVCIHRDGLYSLYSGGWQTSTTKDRLNRYSPAVVCQEGGEWVVYSYQGETRGPRPVKFYEGIRLLDNGKVV